MLAVIHVLSMCKDLVAVDVAVAVPAVIGCSFVPLVH